MPVSFADWHFFVWMLEIEVLQSRASLAPTKARPPQNL
jgi:hypothetical protein